MCGKLFRQFEVCLCEELGEICNLRPLFDATIFVSFDILETFFHEYQCPILRVLFRAFGDQDNSI